MNRQRQSRLSHQRRTGESEERKEVTIRQCGMRVMGDDQLAQLDRRPLVVRTTRRVCDATLLLLVESDSICRVTRLVVYVGQAPRVCVAMTVMWLVGGVIGWSEWSSV